MTAAVGHRRGRGLGLRFMLLVLLCTALFTSLGGLLAWRLGYARALEQSRLTLDSLSDAVERTVATGVFARDKVLVGEIVDGLARNAGVAAVAVRTVQGELMVSKGAERLATATADQVRRRVLVSPFDSHEQIAELQLLADSAQIEAAARDESLRLALLMGGQAVLLAFVLYVVTSRLVSNPIIRLARELHAMVPGTAQRLAVPRANRDDEVGHLVHSANALLEASATALARERALLAEVQAMEAQYRKIFDASSAGIFVLDGEGRLINGNPTVFRVLGRSLSDLRTLGRGSFVQEAFADPLQVREMIGQARAQGRTLSADLALRQQGETVRWVHCLISVQGDASDAPSAAREAVVEGVMYDVTERKSAELAVRYQAEHDALTGLSNRAASEAAIERMLDEALVSGQPMALLLIDLDGFKQVNDGHGHAAGDEVLVACARAMQSAVRRGSDLVGRLGGDEFVVALRGIGADHPMLGATARALLAAVCAPVTLADGRQVRVGASIGIAVCPRHGRDRATLTRQADVTLYQVKAHGKNGFAVALGHGEASSEVLQ